MYVCVRFSVETAFSLIQSRDLWSDWFMPVHWTRVLKGMQWVPAPAQHPR